MKLSRLKNPDLLLGNTHKGIISGVRFIELFAVLGAPDSEDIDGSQFEWHIDFNGQPINLYDYNAGDRIRVLDSNTKWYVGSNSNVGEFIEVLNELIEKNRK